jgi:diguanylate cyclase (GGDEF)-like protein/PAS domain S-box-containing protein
MTSATTAVAVPSDIAVEELFQVLLEQVSDGVYFVDASRRIRLWNSRAEQLTGYSSRDVLGCFCVDNLTHVDDRGHCLCTDSCPLKATLADGKCRQADVYLQHKDGYRVPVHVRIAAVHDAWGKIAGCVQTFCDCSTRQEELERIRRLRQNVYIDETTSLANRNFLLQTLQSRLAEYKRYDHSCGVILADVDSFREIRDRYGPILADRLLRMVGQTMAKNCRPFDVPGRWENDRFLVVAGQAKMPDLMNLAEKLRALVEQSKMVIADEHIYATASMGVTLARPGDYAEDIVARAERLVYCSKQAGRNRVSGE